MFTTSKSLVVIRSSAAPHRVPAEYLRRREIFRQGDPLEVIVIERPCEFFQQHGILPKFLLIEVFIFDAVLVELFQNGGEDAVAHRIAFVGIVVQQLSELLGRPYDPAAMRNYVTANKEKLAFDREKMKYVLKEKQ